MVVEGHVVNPLLGRSHDEFIAEILAEPLVPMVKPELVKQAKHLLYLKCIQNSVGVLSLTINLLYYKRLAWRTSYY